MDETAWMVSTNSQVMLRALRGRDVARKLRWCACACARRGWHLLTDDRLRNAVLVAERFADGQATQEELNGARIAANTATSLPQLPTSYVASILAQIASDTTCPRALVAGDY